MKTEREELATRVLKSLWEVGAIRFGKFKLKSGRISPYYIQLRELSSHNGKCGKILREVADGLWWLIQNEIGGTDRVVGVAYAGIPLAVAITMQSNTPSCFTRKEVKQHGIRGSFVEGILKDKERIVIVGDLITTGDSKMEAIRDVQAEAKKRGISINIAGIVCVFDREEGGREFLRQRNFKLATLIPITWAATYLLSEGFINRQQNREIMKYVEQFTPGEEEA